MPKYIFVELRVSIIGVMAALTLLSAVSESSADNSPSGAESTSLNPLNGVSAPTKDGSIASNIPSALRDKSELVVGLDPSNPPKEFLGSDGKTLQGADVDLVYAIGNVLGLKIKIQPGAFASLIPGAQNGRFDLLNSSMSPSLERQKVLDFVTYDRSGEQLLVKAENADKLNSLTALCGHSAGAVTGGYAEVDMKIASDKCISNGKGKIDLSAFPDANSVILALKSERVEAAFGDSPVSVYQASQSNGALANVGPIYRAGVEGMGMPKKSGLAGPVAEALNALIKSGVYGQILTKWGIGQAGMIDQAVINPPDGGSPVERETTK